MTAQFFSSNGDVAWEFGVFLRKMNNFDLVKLKFFIFFLDFNLH